MGKLALKLEYAKVLIRDETLMRPAQVVQGVSAQPSELRAASSCHPQVGIDRSRSKPWRLKMAFSGVSHVARPTPGPIQAIHTSVYVYNTVYTSSITDIDDICDVYSMCMYIYVI